ncbi:MAG: hypothetical protein V1848_03665 [Candidatus Magasanikbacteria bacterium]
MYAVLTPRKGFSMYTALWIVLSLIGIRVLTWFLNAFRVKRGRLQLGHYSHTGTLYKFHEGTKSLIPPGMQDIVIKLPEAPGKKWLVDTYFFCFGGWHHLPSTELPGHCSFARIQLFFGYGPVTFRFDVRIGQFSEAPEFAPTISIEPPQGNVHKRHPTNFFQRFLGL